MQRGTAAYHGPQPAGQQVVRGAADTRRSPVQHVGVDHRRIDVFVSEQLLHGADVVAVFEQVSGEGVPEGVAGRARRQPGGLDRGSDRVLDHGLVQMVPPALAARGILVGPRCGEDPLPDRIAACFGVLAAECVGQFDPPGSAREVGAVQNLGAAQMLAQRPAHDSREQCDAVTVALALAHADQLAGEVDVLHAQAQAL